MPARVVIDADAVRRYIRAPNGPVMRRMMVKGEAVKQRTLASLKPGFPREFLGPTIVKRVVDTPSGPQVWVGSDHTKTPPHLIRGNPTLSFHWDKVGRVVHFAYVHHPGSQFRNYLVVKLGEALDAVGGVTHD